MTPKIIGIYIDIYKEKEEEKYKILEYQPWLIGKYVADAIGCTFGKHKYPKNPLSEENENSNIQKEEARELTEEEKIKQAEQIFLKLRIMSANFNINHKSDSVS